jgi:hypothetical protein
LPELVVLLPLLVLARRGLLVPVLVRRGLLVLLLARRALVLGALGESQREVVVARRRLLGLLVHQVRHHNPLSEQLGPLLSQMQRAAGLPLSRSSLRQCDRRLAVSSACAGMATSRAG